jgi:hypothetical protein
VDTEKWYRVEEKGRDQGALLLLDESVQWSFTPFSGERKMGQLQFHC